MAALPEHGPLLVAAAWFPPSVGGSSVLSRNLWGAWDPKDLVVLSYRPIEARSDPGLVLEDVRVDLIKQWPFKNLRLAAHLDPLASRAVARAIITLATKCQPRAIWVNWPTTAFLLGAWQASRRLNLPLYVHLHDMWQESYRGTRAYVERSAAWWYERRLLRDARRIFTITEDARKHYLKKLGIDSFVLQHSIPETDLASFSATLASGAKPRVVHFAGYIYPSMNEDALVNVVQALNFCKNDVIFECYTQSEVQLLASVGIGGPRVRVAFVQRRDVMIAQRKADLVILPLAFRSTNPLEIRTVFPTKLLEYLVCGRPILVHAPADSWVSRNARRDGWGEVVDTPDPRLLASSIDRLLAEPQRQESLVAASFAEAKRRAAPVIARSLKGELSRLERDRTTLSRG